MQSRPLPSGPNARCAGPRPLPIVVNVKAAELRAAPVPRRTERTMATLQVFPPSADNEALVAEERTQAFWRQVALTCKAASQAKGFIRLIAFFDGLANWALGFWRTVEDAQAFARSSAHSAAIAEMHEKNFEYMHFAGLYRPVERRSRHAYCERCGAEVVMPQEACPSCGNQFADVFRLQAAH